MATFTHQLRFADLRIDNDAIVISTPEIAGLPYVVAGLVAAGGLAAALSTADGLLLAIANALSHDVYYKIINPNAPTARRLVVARTLLIIVAILAAWVASYRPADIVAMVAWAFSLAPPASFRRWCSGSGPSARPRWARSPAWRRGSASPSSTSWCRATTRPSASTISG
jgi:cation/acetate symporter